MKLRKELVEPLFDEAESFNACLNSHGLYNSFQFVLRLSPEVHRKIKAFHNQGVKTIDGTSFENFQAYSTYLHETIHWWQHIGSTFGFIQSLIYPTQTYMNLSHAKDFISQIGKFKSIICWLEKKSSTAPVEHQQIANIITNNYFDTEFFRLMMHSPSFVNKVINTPFFESQGHSAFITYGNVINLLERSIDIERDQSVFPKYDSWSDYFKELRDEKVDGYFYNGKVFVPKIGALHILEGQARFSQMQFLSSVLLHEVSFDFFKNEGMLFGQYIEAFNFFLEKIKKSYPEKLNDPIVSLFLLVCDLSLNPGEGFPLELRIDRNFIKSIDPGIRFLSFTDLISKNVDEYLKYLNNLDRREYFTLGNLLCEKCGFYTPSVVMRKILDWKESCPNIREVLRESENFEYQPLNLPIRILLSHFIKFTEDKFKFPEFFCWPGIHKVGESVKPEYMDVFNRNLALFVDHPVKHGIYTGFKSEVNKETEKRIIESFYQNNVAYNLFRHWITSKDDFEYEYTWLTHDATLEEYIDFCDRTFKGLVGINFRDLKKVCS